MPLKSGGLKFNGTSDYVKSNITPLTSVNNWSLESWINPLNLNQTSLTIYNGNDAGGYGFGLGSGTGSAGSKLQGLFGGVAYLDSGYTFPNANQFYHVVMLRDSTTTKFYVNGVQTSNTTSSVPNAVTNGITIGCELTNTNTANRFFQGTIGATRIYNRTLSPTEVYNNYQGQVTRSGLVGEWLLNATSGTVAKDTSGNGNDGTLNGCQWVNHQVKQKPKKNMIPSFNSGKWTIDNHYTINSDYAATLNATAANQRATYILPASPSTTYTFSVTTNANFWVDYLDASQNYISGTNNLQNTFITPSNIVYMRITFSNSGAGTFTFTNPQLELGTTATPFEPYTLIPDLVSVKTPLKPAPTPKAVKYSNQVDYQFSRASVEVFNGIQYPMDTPRVDSNGVWICDNTIVKASETLTFPTANVLNASAGTIEVWGIRQSSKNGTNLSWLSFTSGGGFWLGSNASNQFGCPDANITTVMPQVGVPVHITIKWNATNIYVYVNGVLLGTYATTFTLATVVNLGMWRDGSSVPNVSFKSLRIANTARSDADIAQSYQRSLANGYKLDFDDSTTKLLSW